MFGDRRDQLALWTLRLLVHADVLRSLDRLLENDEVRAAIDLVELEVKSTKRLGEAARQKADVLKQRLLELESGEADRSDPLFENVRVFGEMLGLSTVEQELLAFVVEAENEAGLSECAESLPPPTSRRLARLLADVLCCPADEIRAAMSSRGTLISTGLLTPRRYRSDIPYEVITDLDTVLLREHAEEASLWKLFFKVSDQSALSRDDYPHVARDIDLMVGYLGHAIETGLKGVNILLHGRPGTGKTQLAKLIASEVGIPLYEVEVEDSDRDWLKADMRMTAYLTCQRVLEKKKGALVLFDEGEDVFPVERSAAFGYMTRSSQDKGWMNRALEENAAPTIWVSNEVGQIDPAYLRRFDYVLELAVPPRQVRREVLRKHLGDLPVSKTWIERTADNKHITPADMQRAAKVARISGASDPAEVHKTLDKVLDSALKVRGLGLEQKGYRIDAEDYDLGYLNPSCDLGALIGSMGGRSRGSICLYGPPGTGKTAFAFHLAQALDRDLVHRRASDILSKWVGETEANIARMFRHIDTEREILLLDEADSFFAKRSSAVRSWEVTQVNELLVQMEAFDGLFICATNLMDWLDQAAFRRFALKIKLDYLKPDQRWRMFESMLSVMGERAKKAQAKRLRYRMDRLSRLTPGDFAAVRRRMRLLDNVLSPDELISALEEECSFKPGAGDKKVGFGA